METEVVESNYHCSIEWHLAKLERFAAILYPFAFRLSRRSQRFHCSAVGLAQHFGVSQWTVLRALRSLTEAGLFTLLAKEPFRPSVYRVVSHEEWVQKHPATCIVKSTFPWSNEENDALAIQLHNASGGRVKYHTFQLVALRKTGIPDDQIVKAFQLFIEHEHARRQSKGWHGRWSSVPGRFLRYLKGEISPQDLQQLGLEKFLREV